MGSWGITQLKGVARGVCYLLYAVIDIFSCKAIWWEIRPAETGPLAKEFREHAIEADRVLPRSVQAGRGASMTSNTVSGLRAPLGIDPSHSRPRVSSGNPHPKARTRTPGIGVRFLGAFGSIEDTGVFCGRFFRYYNIEHRHSGTGMRTPALVHERSAAEIDAKRVAIVSAAARSHLNGSAAGAPARRRCPPGCGSTDRQSPFKPRSQHKRHK